MVKKSGRILLLFICPLLLHACITAGQENAGNGSKPALLRSKDWGKYDLNCGSVDTGEWTYIAFIKRSPEYRGETRLHLFLDYLVKESLISGSSSLATIELGNEIVYGTGKTQIKDYRIDLQYNE